MDEPGYVAETLAWCNKRRKERGKKPLKKLPKGRRYQAFSCPCGKATGLWVASEWIGSHARGNIPRSVSRFIVAFDAGRLPQYEAKR
jgi:hypothetical protein